MTTTTTEPDEPTDDRPFADPNMNIAYLIGRMSGYLDALRTDPPPQPPRLTGPYERKETSVSTTPAKTRAGRVHTIAGWTIIASPVVAALGIAAHKIGLEFVGVVLSVAVILAVTGIAGGALVEAGWKRRDKARRLAEMAATLTTEMEK